MLSVSNPVRFTLLLWLCSCVLGALSKSSTRVLLVAPSFPWKYGPYQSQQAQLGSELAARGYDVFWSGAFRDLGSAGALTAEQAAAALKTTLPTDHLLGIAKLFTYINIPQSKTFQGTVKMGRAITVRSINELAVAHNIKAVIFLMDGNNIFVDESFKIYSMMWYPLHFSSLIPWARDILRKFDTVVALSPSAAEILSEAKNKLRHVATVPHIVEKPIGWTSQSRTELRIKYQVPLDAFVVLVNCGNYEPSNRKGLDVALLAFKSLLKTVPEAFLYLKVISIRNILAAEGVPAETNSIPAVDLPTLIRQIELPDASYILQQDLLDLTAAWDLMLMADVLFMPSKAEGFGMPMLEAQLIGTPVVTTAFGAMKDYTRYGVSVEPVQPLFMEVGFAVTPSIAGSVAALIEVYNNRSSQRRFAVRNAAISWVQAEFNRQKVGSLFDSLITSGIANKTEMLSISWDALVQTEAQVDWFFSLSFEKPQRLLDLMDLGENAPQWTLLWSETANLRLDVLESLEEKFHNGVSPEGGDVIFYLTMRSNGSTFPDVDDLQKGVLVPNSIILLRTDRFLNAARHTGFAVLDQILRTVLSNQLPFKRKMEIRVHHMVIADEKSNLATNEVYVS